MVLKDFFNDDEEEYAKGGRIGYRYGGNGDEDDPGHADEPLIIPDDTDVSPWDDWEGKRKGIEGQMAGGIYEKALMDAWNTYKKQKGTLSLEQFADLWMREMMKKAQGGRIGKYLGGMGLPGIPGIPRMAPDGMEFDMRENGGFQGLGAKEGKDDVPAMLAKNEFVFTADAVRGAGGGDIELGAQRMYDTMKNLERRVT